MPINPQIVTAQLPGIQIENPMTFARNALAMKQAQSEIAANELAAQEAGRFNALIAASQKPDGAPITRDLLIRQGLYKRAKELQETENALATGEKTKLDVIGSAMDTSSRLLDTVRTPQEMMAWHEANHADPVLGPYLAARGITAEQSRAKIAAASQDPAAFQQLLLDSRLGLEKSREQHFIEQEYGGGTRVLGMSKYGGPARVVEGSDIAVTPSPNRPVTQILMPAETERQKALGKGGAEADIAEYNTVRSAARSINKDYETIKLLQEGKPSTGITAELELGFNRLKAAAGGKPDAIEKVADTEYLEALLGSDVFNQFQALGVGARGLDTKAEREFLQQVISGTRTLDKETLIRMAEMRAKYKRSIVEEFNERVESGELNNFFRDYGRTKRPFALPKPPEVTVTGPGGKPLGSQGVPVNVPNRGTVVFPNKEAADAFKAAAGIE